jgi:hypothetical protein
MKLLKAVLPHVYTAAFAIAISALFSLPFIGVFLTLFALGMIIQPGAALRTIVSNPLIGASRKSMGNATFSNWKGIYILKTKPISVANPQSDAQVQQRSAFSQMVTAFRNNPAAIRKGFKEFAVKKSEFNAFMSYNLKNAFDYSVPGTATLLPELVLTSRGTVASTPILSAIADRSNNTIVITTAATANQPGQSLTDVYTVSAYNETLDDFYGEVTTAARSTGTASIALPAEWLTGNNLTVYVGLYNSLSNKESDSVAIATSVVA